MIEMAKVERKFWNKKYEQGGISGRGSIGFYRNWKWNQLQFNCEVPNHYSVIDVGCGDLSFWNHPIPKKMMKDRNFKYTGIDISDNIIHRNRKVWPQHDFIIAPAHIEQPDRRASLVLAMDLLFHIMDDGEYEVALETLCRYTLKYLAIYAWKKNPFLVQNIESDGISQTFRKLGDSKYIFLHNNMMLIRAVDVPFDQFGRLYVFKRVLY
jgi:hypothetical protein